MSRTRHASVDDFQVSLQFLEARARAFELGVGYSNFAHASAAAAPVGDAHDVTMTAKVTDVDLDAPAELHAPVERPLDDDHFAVGTFRSEHFRVAVVASVTWKNRASFDALSITAKSQLLLRR